MWRATNISKKKNDYPEKDCRYWFENKGPQKFVENWSTILRRTVEYKPQILLLNVKISLNNYPKKDCYWEYADVEEHPIYKKKIDYPEKDCRYWFENKGRQKFVENWSTTLKRTWI